MLFVLERSWAISLRRSCASFFNNNWFKTVNTRAPEPRGQWGQPGGSKVPFPKKNYSRGILIHINIQREASCVLSAVTIIEQVPLLLRSQYVLKRCLAKYAKRLFPIWFNSKLWQLEVPYLWFLPPPHHEAYGASGSHIKTNVPGLIGRAYGLNKFYDYK